MFSEILTETYYGNTVGAWATALLIIVAALVVGKALYWVCSRLLRKLTAKTQTKADDIILDMIEEPVVLAITVAGIWYGLSTLKLGDGTRTLIGNSLQFVIVLSVTWLIARLLESLFTHYLTPLAEKSENDLDDQLLPIARKGAKLSVWTIGIIVALNNAGYEVGAVIAGLGIGGLALAMAAKDTVSNIFGGFTIFVDRPFGLNDRIRIDGFDGVVEDIGIRSTRLRTRNGTLVTIPNATFSASSVENVSLEKWRRVDLELGLTYDTKPEDVDRAIAIMREITDQTEGLEEKVTVAFMGFGDSSLNFRLRYDITKGTDIYGTRSAINLAVLRRFDEAGLEFAFPTRTLYTVDRD